MSSTQQSEAEKLHAMLAERGVAFVDAPVSGGVLGAEAATLAIMAGGSEADFQRAQPVLTVMGRATRVGPVGSGQLAKLCNQLIVGGTLSIIAEALLLAQAGGADPARCARPFVVDLRKVACWKCMVSVCWIANLSQVGRSRHKPKTWTIS